VVFVVSIPLMYLSMAFPLCVMNVLLRIGGGSMSDYLNYLDEVYTDLVAEYGEGITLAYHEANIKEM
jgi:hypothetical protein